MMQTLRYASACLLALAAPRWAVAQATASSDSVAVTRAVAAAAQHYTQQVRPESVLFSGPEYVDYNQPSNIGHPFFLSAEPQLGSVVYRGATFGAVPLRYDLARDQVVMTYPNQAVTVALVPEQLAAFSLGPHQFVRVLGDSATGTALPTGYYEVLQPGPISLLARHTKRMQQTTVQQELRLEFKQTDQLFARTASTASQVASLKDLLVLLPTHKAEVQHYAHQQKLRFSAAQREASALSTLRYYYTLPQ